MAKLAEQFQYVSGITWFDIYQRPASGAATLSTITADQWSEVGGFREGTFSFTGDEMEITSHKYENGQEIISTTTDGTYGFEGDLANVAEEICTNLLQMDVLTLTADSGAFVKDRKVLGAGKKLAVIENCMVRSVSRRASGTRWCTRTARFPRVSKAKVLRRSSSTSTSTLRRRRVRTRTLRATSTSSSGRTDRRSQVVLPKLRPPSRSSEQSITERGRVF